MQEGDWKKNDMFFEYRLKEGESLRSVSFSPSRTSRAHCPLLFVLIVMMSAPSDPAQLCESPSVTTYARRLQGNELFKEGKYSEAAVKYRKGLYYSVFDDSQFNFELQDDHRSRPSTPSTSHSRPLRQAPELTKPSAGSAS